MKKGIFSFIFLALFSFISTTAFGAAYIRGATAPWGEATNEAAMDTVFGAGNWADLRMAGGVAPFLPGSGHNFIFLEGGDDTANELNAYLTANRAAIEAFVTNGGALFLNSAPNEGGNIDFGFGGVMLTYNGGTASDSVVASNPAHPIFVGPQLPVGTAFTGSSFGHALVGGGVTPIIVGAAGDPQAGLTILGEKSFGAGIVILGGVTTNNFHNPVVNAANLRANILQYLANGAVLAPPTDVPTLSQWALMLLILALGVVSVRVSRHY